MVRRLTVMSCGLLKDRENADRKEIRFLLERSQLSLERGRSSSL